MGGRAFGFRLTDRCMPVPDFAWLGFWADSCLSPILFGPDLGPMHACPQLRLALILARFMPVPDFAWP